MAPASTSSAPGQLSKRPQDSDFYQQRLKAWQPILTPKWVIVTFLIVGAIFVVIGILLKAASDRVVEYSVQYDGPAAAAGDTVYNNIYSACHVDNGTAPRECQLTFTVAKEMTAPVYVYYELQNFYQNHRRYVKSRSDKQLAGTIYTDTTALSDCSPLISRNINGTDKILDPCGLIANSYFNDTFQMSSSDPGLTMSESGISWQSDRDKKFKAVSAADKAKYADQLVFINETYPDVQDVTNEHFIVWMRVAALPNFRKLYGKIDTTIPANTNLTFSVVSNYPVSGFSGKKSLVLSTVSFLGGKNPFLGIAYIAVGALCLFLALVFGIRQFFGGRRLGDTSYLTWTTKR